MKNPTPQRVGRDAQANTSSAGSKALPRYESPSIMTYDGEKILQQVGPAQGYGQTGIPIDDDSSS